MIGVASSPLIELPEELSPFAVGILDVGKNVGFIVGFIVGHEVGFNV
eukprot:CAMPEP_0197307684 /NCGR_PEP_ID=MMETSP0891-20130614/5606_1 /TAXON_ID=44058 ORGANISM="Aureoumbra lagunensis, Strain CCMP1510" /NCGR_SAMPLE_ID=MMETSP0891 /ASSEMBLY_ACC=CAM_ASM_000534 /LENGTH=46 /DNA_ID= /DNA_START= /DNA_END= /DNA_ORIENTATION=